MIPASGEARQLTLTARLNTAAADSRRGVVRMHPNAVAALGIREWDAVSLTGSRTTAAVAGLAGPDTPVGTVLLDDVTLSNAGLREDTAVIISAVTVYGARSVTLSGSSMAATSITSVTLRQALLGKVMTVGDAVSLLPRDLGPGTSTSAATRALAAAVGISWTSELLTVTGVDPEGPVSVQPNSFVTWGTGVPAGMGIVGASSHERLSAGTPEILVEELKGSQPQAAKLAEWLKLSLDEPHLLKTLGAGTNLGVLVSGPAGVGKVTLVRAVCDGRRLIELDGPEVGALAADDRLKTVASAVKKVRDGGGVLLIADVDALLPATAEPVAALILGDLRAAVATEGVALIATSATRPARYPAARPRPVRPRAGPAAARRGHPQGAPGDAAQTGAHRRSRPRRDRRSHTGFRRRRPCRPGARSRAAGGVSGPYGRPTTEAEPGRSRRRADRHPATVPLGQRGADHGQRDAR